MYMQLFKINNMYCAIIKIISFLRLIFWII